MPIVGTQQSPVRIVRSESFKADFPKGYVRFKYPNRALAGEFSGPQDLNFLFDAPHVRITFSGRQWDLRKIHIHHKAEHRFDDDEAADFEAHLVHFLPGDLDGTGPKVVAGILFRKDQNAAVSKKGLARLNMAFRERAAGGVTPDTSGIEINPSHFLPADPDRWYHYEGSLTSGSFSEDVGWFVMADEIAVNPQDTAELEKHAKQHAREVFPLNRRFVLRNF